MLTVFLSHCISKGDLPIASAIEDRLGRHGIATYLAERDPQPGSSLSAKILERIHASDIVAVLWTKGGADSHWVNQEVGAARAAGKLVIPMVEMGVRTKGMLEGVEYIELSRTDPSISLESIELYVVRLQQAKEAAAEEKRREDLRTLGIAIGAGIAIVAAIAVVLYVTSRR